MDLKKYDELRKKISTKDFEGNNKTLDKWLYGFSFIGNIVSIFFSYFLLYPALLKAISINLVSGMWGTILAFIFANTFLIIFEIVKRYLFRNFSSDFVASGRKLSASLLGWLSVSVAIVSLSFFLSLVGAKNLASTSVTKNTVATTTVDIQKDNLAITYENKKKTYEVDNQSLRNVNNDLRNTLAQTPVNYVSIRRDYQSSIDKNTKIIESNQAEINKIDEQLKQRVEELKSGLNTTIAGNATEDTKNIFLFIIIAIFAECIIIGGIYFREWYEYNLYLINQQKFERIYQKKDRYRILTTFIYNKGNTKIGDSVLSGLELKKVANEKMNVQNKFVDEYLYEMDSLGIFVVNGKRRRISKTYDEAIQLIDDYENIIDVFDELK